jgi:hypothetical protein
MSVVPTLSNVPMVVGVLMTLDKVADLNVTKEPDARECRAVHVGAFPTHTVPGAPVQVPLAEALIVTLPVLVRGLTIGIHQFLLPAHVFLMPPDGASEKQATSEELMARPLTPAKEPAEAGIAMSRAANVVSFRLFMERILSLLDRQRRAGVHAACHDAAQSEF